MLRQTALWLAMLWEPKARTAVGQGFRFCIIGALTAGLDIALLYVLVSFCTVHYFVAAGLSFTLAVLLNYYLSVLWVFASGKFSRRREIIFFWAISVGGLGLNQVVMWILVGGAGINYMLAKWTSLLVVTAWNFVGKKRVVFDD